MRQKSTEPPRNINQLFFGSYGNTTNSSSLIKYTNTMSLSLRRWTHYPVIKAHRVSHPKSQSGLGALKEGEHRAGHWRQTTHLQRLNLLSDAVVRRHLERVGVRKRSHGRRQKDVEFGGGVGHVQVKGKKQKHNQNKWDKTTWYLNSWYRDWTWICVIQTQWCVLHAT